MSLSLSAADWALVRASSLFGDLDQADLRFLLEPATVLTPPAKSMLFTQHDPASHFYVCLEGQVLLFSLTANGDHSIVEIIGPGQSFAEAAIFASRNYPVSAECQAQTRLVRIPAAAFLTRLAERQGAWAHVLVSLARWERWLQQEINEIKNKTPVERVARFLLAACPDAGDRPLPLTVDIPFSKVQLAARIGITPESLSRALTRLRAVGVMAQGRRFLIQDVAALQQLCGK